MERFCLNCGKQLVSYQKKYCSPKCQQDYQKQQKILQWKNQEFSGLKGKYQISNTIRNYLLEKANYSCECCGWSKINPFTNKIPLEIHHIDGDYRNNREDNLQVLCPNCHSLTSTYKGSNKNGREDRSIYENRKNFEEKL